MRAIILAAGMGTRLRPITLTTPKSLIKIGNETLIERQIHFLREKGIDEIIIVTGHLAEKFEFLKDKYQVTLVHNDKYAIYNNFYTMYLVKQYLSNTYVIDADNYLVDNFLSNNLETSTYFSAYKTNFKQEWVLHTNSNSFVTDITIEDGEGPIMCGVSYWNSTDGALLQEAIEKKFELGNYADIYWDNIVLEQLPNLNVKIQSISHNSIFEIDSLEDLQHLHNVLGYSQYQSDK